MRVLCKKAFVNTVDEYANWRALHTCLNLTSSRFSPYFSFIYSTMFDPILVEGPLLMPVRDAFKRLPAFTDGFKVVLHSYRVDSAEDFDVDDVLLVSKGCLLCSCASL